VSNFLDNFAFDAPDFPNAVCATTAHPDLFFPEHGGGAQAKADIELAKTICMSCVHRVECAEYAINEHIEDGVWGATTPRERTALRGKVTRKRRISDAGQRVEEMKARGMTYRQIAAVLDMTPNAAQAAYLRHKRRSEASA
jgi:WhiB family redox-sensing transcriptional regulator